MTYLQFLIIFVCAPAALLVALGFYQVGLRHRDRAWLRWHWLGIMALAGIALVWTTPWDNYIVANGVWTYGADRVLATIGYVPVEEYAFFILMPIYNGGLFVCLTEALGGIQRSPRKSRIRSKVFVSLFGAAVLAAAFLLFRFSENFFYLSTTLLWFVPPLMVQWYYDANSLIANFRLIFLSTVLPTLYLSAADLFAIQQGIWTISDPTRTGLDLLGLPIEEAFFFFIVSLLLSQGLVLWHSLKRP